MLVKLNIRFSNEETMCVDMNTLQNDISFLDSLVVADHLGLLEAKKNVMFRYTEKAIVHGNPDRVHEHAKLMENHWLVASKRGFVSYYGYYKKEPILITTSGMGTGSAAIVFEELVEHGINKILRVGTCGYYRDYIKPGDIVIPTEILLEGPSLRYIFPDYLREREISTEISWLYVREGFYFVKGFEKFVEILVESVENVLDEYKEKLSIRYYVGPLHDKDVLHAWREKYSLNPETLMRIKNKVTNLTIATDMESGALFTIGHIRNTIVGSILVAVDFHANKDTMERQRKGMEIAYKASLEAISRI